jgi:hypothetical protein
LWYLGVDSKASFRYRKEDDGKLSHLGQFPTDVDAGKFMQLHIFSTEQKSENDRIIAYSAPREISDRVGHMTFETLENISVCILLLD